MTNANSYTVYDNKTDELVILDGTSKECAEAMGVTLGTFHSYLCKSKQGIIRWTITENRKAWREQMIDLIGKMKYNDHEKIAYIAYKLKMKEETVKIYLKRYRRRNK